jgi:hypothetical protein
MAYGVEIFLTVVLWQPGKPGFIADGDRYPVSLAKVSIGAEIVPVIGS